MACWTLYSPYQTEKMGMSVTPSAYLSATHLISYSILTLICTTSPSYHLPNLSAYAEISIHSSYACYFLICTILSWLFTCNSYLLRPSRMSHFLLFSYESFCYLLNTIRRTYSAISMAYRSIHVSLWLDLSIFVYIVACKGHSLFRLGLLYLSIYWTINPLRAFTPKSLLYSILSLHPLRSVALRWASESAIWSSYSAS